MNDYIDLTASSEHRQRYVMVVDDDAIYFIKDDSDLDTLISERYHRSYVADVVINRKTMKVTKSRHFGVDSSDYV